MCGFWSDRLASAGADLVGTASAFSAGAGLRMRSMSRANGSTRLCVAAAGSAGNGSGRGSSGTAVSDCAADMRRRRAVGRLRAASGTAGVAQAVQRRRAGRRARCRRRSPASCRPARSWRATGRSGRAADRPARSRSYWRVLMSLLLAGLLGAQQIAPRRRRAWRWPRAPVRASVTRSSLTSPCATLSCASRAARSCSSCTARFRSVWSGRDDAAQFVGDLLARAGELRLRAPGVADGAARAGPPAGRPPASAPHIGRAVRSSALEASSSGKRAAEHRVDVDRRASTRPWH